MKRWGGLLLFICLLLFFSFVSYATDFRDKDVHKSSQTTWEQAKAWIEAKINDKESFAQYTKSMAIKDLQYLRYICLTHQVGYDDYAELEDGYLDTVLEVLNMTLTCYSEEDYKRDLVAYKKFAEVEENPYEKEIANTGFSAKRDVLPFSNLSFEDNVQGGICAGISYYEIFHYIKPEILGKLDFSEVLAVLKESNDKNYKNAKKLRLSIDASDDDIIGLSSLSKYEPEDSHLRYHVIDEYRRKWDDTSDMEKGNPCIEDLYGEDERLCTTLIWLFIWGNINDSEQLKVLSKEGHRLQNVDVMPSTILDELIAEFNKGRPVMVCASDASKNGAHALVGYKLKQDKKDPNMYYLYVADSNFPGNYYNGSQWDFKINMYVSTYKGQPAIFSNYTPLKDADDTEDYSFVNTYEFISATGRVLNPSMKMDTWGKSTEWITIPLNYFKGLDIK